MSQVVIKPLSDGILLILFSILYIFVQYDGIGQLAFTLNITLFQKSSPPLPYKFPL